jgi:hypothetical protein
MDFFLGQCVKKRDEYKNVFAYKGKLNYFYKEYFTRISVPEFDTFFTDLFVPRVYLFENICLHIRCLK